MSFLSSISSASTRNSSLSSSSSSSLYTTSSLTSSSDINDNSNITTVLLIYLNVLKSTIRWDFILFVSLFLSLLLTPISIGNFIYYIIMLMNFNNDYNNI